MDLMTLAAKITLDDKEFRQGVGGAEKMGQQLAGKMNAMTVAVGNIAADMIKKGIGAITSVVSGAVDGYADYQQLIGGVETLFKTSASKVANYAKQSYKTTGLSANDYMETVTSFSASLLQGLKGDTETAADLANVAVTDMADNANKMGTDISSIQAAYQGFAKQNYTMLDNLKLGYGGTREEMVRLINDSGILDEEISDLDGITFDQLVKAIHEIQTQMGITGTTAKEAADTISGSKASLEAAWSDFLASVGGETDQAKLSEAGENFKTAFNTYVVQNLAPAIENTMKNSPELIKAVSEAITDLPSQAISDLALSGIDILTAGVNAAADLAGWLIDGLVNLFKDINADPSKIAELGNAVGEFIGSALSDIVTNAPTIVSGLFTAGVSLAGSLVEGLFSGLFGTDSDSLPGLISDADKEVNDAIKDAEKSSTRAQGIVEYMKGLVDQYGLLGTKTEEWKSALSRLDEELPGVKEWAESQKSSIQGVIAAMEGWIELQRKTSIEEAKKKALATKEEAWTNAQAELLSAQSEIMIQKNINDEARKSLVDFIKGVTGEEGFTGANADAEQLKAIAYAALGDKYANGAGDEGYAEDAAQLEAWTSELTQSESNIQGLEASLDGLEKNVTIAKTSYMTSSAAIDELTGSASGAAQALQAIKTPSITYKGGEYAAWYYGQNTPGHATGLSFVPYDRYKAELHRGESVLSKAEAQRYRSGEGTAEMIGALQGLRGDLSNLKLVVGEKTFGRAVVGYGGSRVDNYIGQAESRKSAGYGT